MGKTNGEAYFKSHYQEYIDKYGFKEALELGKRIGRIRYKKIDKGRFSGDGTNGMTYDYDVTNDTWFTSKYGKDGTNVTEIQINGPWEKDANGRDVRNILYLFSAGRETIRPKTPNVKQLVDKIMHGPRVLKVGAKDYAWNAED